MRGRRPLRSRLLGGLFVAVLVAATAWLYSQLEWQVTEVDRGYSEAAQRNPFLAAQLYLEALGIPTQSHRGMGLLDELPAPESATLVMVTTSRSLSQRRLDNLWRWIEAGGHLITNVAGATNTRTGEISDPLLAELGVDVFPVDEAAQAVGALSPNGLINTHPNRRSQGCRPPEEAFSVELDEGQRIEIALRTDLYLVDRHDSAQAAVVNRHGPQLLQYGVGEGLVTLVSDPDLWSNSQIACFDNAYLLWFLSEDEGVWILHHLEMPSLFRLMWEQAALALSLSALLLVLWLWRRSRRFGPLLGADVTRRRSLLEHLQASAMFAWRNGHAEALVVELQQAIRQRMAYHHAGFRGLDFEAQCAAIAQLTRHPPAQVAAVMGPPSLAKPHHLVATVQGLQTIRNRL